MAGLLKELREELVGLDGDRDAQLNKIVAALDANDKNSLLRKLMDQMGAAQEQLLAAIDPELPHSPLAAIQRTVASLLEAQNKTAEETLANYEKGQKEVAMLVKDAVTRFDTRKEADATSPRGGNKFEDDVVDFLERKTQGDAYGVRPVGTVNGHKGKVGDAVVEFLGETPFNGCRVVFEAKRDLSYTVPKALDELDRARENRDASVGVFVMARSHARPNFPQFQRYGNNILVTWDQEDPLTDCYLEAATMASLAMVARRRSSVDDGDLNALRDIDKRIVNELNRYSRIRNSNERISSSADDIREELRKGEAKLDILLKNARETLKALNVEVSEEEVERECPIGLVKAGEPGLAGAGELENGEVSRRFEVCGTSEARVRDPKDSC